MDWMERRYLFERHTPEQLAAWGRRLQRFRFCRAYGGHAGDGDALRLSLRLEAPGEGLEIVGALGAVRQPREPRRLDPATVPDHPGTEQPGWCDVAGVPAFLWIHPGRLDVTLHDPEDVWSVTDEAVRSAERLEPHFAPYDDRRLDPPVDSWHCIAPQTHPELFT